MLTIIPAVDILGGRCVRLTRGEYARSKVYAEDPLDAALRWRDAGATWLHVVDLDGAKKGRMINRTIIERILSRVALHTEVGGGIRDARTAAALLKAGADRVIMGTAALADCDRFIRLASAHPRRIWLSVDAKKENVMVRGWTAKSGVTVRELLGMAAKWPIGGVIVTSILHDGVLKGPDLAAARAALGAFPRSVIMSGGISSPSDIRALKKIGAKNLVGLIVGKALYEGRMSFAVARRAAA